MVWGGQEMKLSPCGYIAALVILLIGSTLLLGCADNYIRVMKLDASGVYNPFSARAGGCSVEIQGMPTGIELTYIDAECNVKVVK
jgi:hypothetical protein